MSSCSLEIQNKILEPLSPEQRVVVSHSDGHALVSAVAGSGKTVTLIHRILFLLNQGVSNDKILVVMYNRDVKESFKGRLEKACNAFKFKAPVVLTYHSLGKRVCDVLVKAGYLEGAEYITNEYKYWPHLQRALERAIKEGANEKKDEEKYHDDHEVIYEFCGLIERWKGDLLLPEEVVGSTDYKDVQQFIKKAYGYFEELRLLEGFRTFADMIYDPAVAIKNSLEVDSHVGNRYEYILIDEYQDVNLAQQELIQSIAGTKASVMAVGDEDQCIYEWRGSRPDYMTGLFEQFFNGAHLFSLSHTFRFGHTLSCVANTVMYHNKNRNKKLCISGQNTPRTTINLHLREDGDSKGLIPSLIQKWLDRGGKFKDITILVRSWAMALEPEMELMSLGIPYDLADKSKSYRSRPEIQACIGFMSLGMRSDLSHIECQETRKKNYSAMLRYSGLYLKKQQRDNFIKRLSENGAEPANVFSSVGEKVPKLRNQLQKVCKIWQGLEATISPSMPAGEALCIIIQALDFQSKIQKNHVQKQVANDAIRAIEILVDYAFSQKIRVEDLISELNNSATVEKSLDGDMILITSIHKAKGGQWPMVIIPRLEEGRFPHYEDNVEDPYHLEQERRLFYVAITRASDEVDLIAPRDKKLVTWLTKEFWGYPKSGDLVASRFLFETNLLRSKNVIEKFYEGVSPNDIELGEKEYLLKNYLKNVQ